MMVPPKAQRDQNQLCLPSFVDQKPDDWSRIVLRKKIGGADAKYSGFPGCERADLQVHWRKNETNATRCGKKRSSSRFGETHDPHRS